MSTSYNGWYASPNIATRDLFAGGVEIVPGILDNDDVYTVMHYVAQQFHERVETLHAGWCWGFNFRYTTGDSSTLSNHSSATAMDLNAPAHPYSVRTTSTFSAAQIAEVHKILDEVGHVVEWGGDYQNHPQDGMHFDIAANAYEVGLVADKIRNNQTREWDEMATKEEIQAAVRSVVREEIRDAGFIKGLVDMVWQREFSAVNANGVGVSKKAREYLTGAWETVKSLS